MSDTCHLCGAPIVWAAFTSGNRVPVELDPNGHLVADVYAGALRVIVKPPDLFAEPDLFTDTAPERRYAAHLSACPGRASSPTRGASVDPRATGGGLAQANHPETSRKAGRLVRSGSQHAAVLAALHRLGDATAFELAASPELVEVRPGIPPNQVASRLSELRERGLVERVAFDCTRHDEDVDGIGARRAATGPALCHHLTGPGRVEEGRLRGL